MEGLVEIIELQGHPWFVGTQFHQRVSVSPAILLTLFFCHFIGAAESSVRKN